MKPAHGCSLQLISVEIYLECALQLNTNLYSKHLFLVSVKSNIASLVFLNDNSGCCAEHGGNRVRVDTGRLTMFK